VTATVAVADSSPLIVFHQIGRLELLRNLSGKVVAPPSVAAEIVPSLGGLPPWVTERRPPSPPELLMILDAGEREAIALALHISAFPPMLSCWMTSPVDGRPLNLDCTSWDRQGWC
jgi:predicted nucleic acid-binding protein